MRPAYSRSSVLCARSTPAQCLGDFWAARHQFRQGFVPLEFGRSFLQLIGNWPGLHVRHAGHRRQLRQAAVYWLRASASWSLAEFASNAHLQHVDLADFLGGKQFLGRGKTLVADADQLILQLNHLLGRNDVITVCARRSELGRAGFAGRIRPG